MSFRVKELESKLVEHGYTEEVTAIGDIQYVKMNETGEWVENSFTKTHADTFEVSIANHPTFCMMSRRRNDGFEESNGTLYVFGTYGGYYKA